MSSSPIIMKRTFEVIGFRFRERLGFFRKELCRRLGHLSKPIWLHGASVGEVLLCLKVAKALRPFVQNDLLFSAMTPEGIKLLEEKGEVVLPFPLDLPFSVRKYLEAIRPKTILIAESEIWPNLILCAKRNGIPLAIFNARISPLNFKRLCLFRSLFRKAFSELSLVLARSSEDAERFIYLGVPEEKVTITGDLKLLRPFWPEWDKVEALKAEFELSNQKVIIAGSTHRGEEELVLNAFLKLRESFPDLRLIIAPRHIQRASEVIEHSKAFGFKTTRRTAISSGYWDVMVLDTVGELRNFYGLANVTFVGGSFIKKVGGHNLLEPLVWGRPVIFGPFVENFKGLAKKLQGEGIGVKATSLEELVHCLHRFLAFGSPYEEISKRTEALFEEGKRAFEKTLSAIKGLLE